jgi:molecular chaperone GrpE
VSAADHEPREPESRPPGVSDEATPDSGTPDAQAADAAPADAAPADAPAAEAAPSPTADFRDRWLRAEAEAQNVRRRAQREVEDARRVAEDAVLLEMVAALDDLERALTAAREAEAPESWTRGVDLVAQRLRDSLARFGVVAVDPVGEPFDPTIHDALLEVDPPAGAAPGSVVQVIHRGYRRGDRALRTARVVVAKHGAEG